ncbi:MAG: type III pantothenate kinase [Paracoccus sp. (in: a-proteobacteria)]|uniref:type III pantothenate kinase n=1 Tax=Paracoccus sp. TaxID=267 RepID=UPI0026DFFF4A|nr:type III pantothenate kinase [Paracoccus sp. (in: a-proteobacteria)]MDO5613209.1 type III pantothenate kinase [Paracoccus sp. (in: a-proteobacteria)]
MLLCIDTGNTNSVFSLWDGEQFVSHWRISTDPRRTADEYFVWLQTMISLTHFDLDIDSCIISSTVPRVVFNLRVLCNRYFNTRPLVVGKPDCLLPMAPRVEPGSAVGPDRIVNTWAAHVRHGGDLVVVDFGTATTFDVADTDGAYIGGVIAPGVNLSLEALHMGAASLPHVDVTMPPQVIGRNTVACIQSGIFWGYIGLVQGIVQKIRQERARPMKVIATGGLAPLFDQGFDLFDAIEDDLTVHGLRLIYDHNREAGNV